MGAKCLIQRALSKLTRLVHKCELVKGFYRVFSKIKCSDFLTLTDAKYSKTNDIFDLIHAPPALMRPHVRGW